MNYIKQLQAKIAELKSEKEEAANRLDDLRVYLSSEKFHNDTTVQVGDVLRRLPRIY